MRMLVDAALEVFESNRFAPATQDGVPISGDVVFVVRFVLHK